MSNSILNSSNGKYFCRIGENPNACPGCEPGAECEGAYVYKYELPTSQSFGDIPLYDFLQWHLSVCQECNPNLPVPAFGQKDQRHCEDYYGIVQEYSDYERDYVMKGNP